jgi:hypothetical protein
MIFYTDTNIHNDTDEPIDPSTNDVFGKIGRLLLQLASFPDKPQEQPYSAPQPADKQEHTEQQLVDKFEPLVAVELVPDMLQHKNYTELEFDHNKNNSLNLILNSLKFS